MPPSWPERSSAKPLPQSPVGKASVQPALTPPPPRSPWCPGPSGSPNAPSSIADDGFARVENGVLLPHAVPRTQAAELRALCGLRDTAKALLEAEAATRDDTQAIAEVRAELNHRYDAYVATYGPINRCSFREVGQPDEAGERRLAQFRPRPWRVRQGPLRRCRRRPGDLRPRNPARPQSPTAVPPGHRPCPRPPRRRHPRGRPGDLPGRAGQGRPGRGRPPPRRRGEAKPASGWPAGVRRPGLGPAPACGRVPLRQRPGEARRRPGSGARRARLPGQRRGTPGGPASRARPSGDQRPPGRGLDRVGYVQDFLRETLEDSYLRVEHAGGAQWTVRGGRWGVQATSTWGTTRRPGGDLAEALLRQAPVIVYDEDADGRRVANPTETAAAQEKAGLLAQRFSEWCWEDPEPASALLPPTTNGSTLWSCAPTTAQRRSCPAWRCRSSRRHHQLAARRASWPRPPRCSPTRSGRARRPRW